MKIAEYKIITKAFLLCVLVMFICVFFYNKFYLENNKLKNSDNIINNKITEITPEVEYKNEDKTPEYQKDIKEKVIKMLIDGDSKSVIHVFEYLKKDESIYSNCHALAHDIGHEAYEKYGFYSAMNFDDKTFSNKLQYVCAGGYLHGILEKAGEDDMEIETKPDKLCISVSYNFKDNCYHGIGHALMFSFENDYNKSLISCGKLNDKFYSMRCSEGVWMEYYYSDGGPKDTADIKFSINNIFKECDNISDSLEFSKPACYMYAPMGYLSVNRYKYEDILQICDLVKDLNNSSFCFKGVGIYVSHIKYNKVTEMEDMLRGYWKIKRKAFYQGVYGYASLYGISKNILLNYCNDFKSKEDKIICREINK